MAVRAKFKVTSVQKYGETKATDPQGNAVTFHQTNVVLSPVYVSNPERAAGVTDNEMFGFYTPNGKVEMSIQNDAAAEQFKPDAVFYVDFTPAE